MNFLELCQRTRQEASIPGVGPSAVTGQTGEMKAIVDWVATAWDEIQNRRPNWRWQRADWTFNTTAGTGVYLPAQAGAATRFAWWDQARSKIYLTSKGVSDEGPIDFIDWAVWDRLYNTGAQTDARPQVMAERPEDHALLLAPVPDDVYTLSGTYWKSRQQLAANTDTPEMPVEYHMLIVYEAVRMYAEVEENAWLADRMENRASYWMTMLEQHQLEPLRIGARPLGNVLSGPERIVHLETGFPLG